MITVYHISADQPLSTEQLSALQSLLPSKEKEKFAAYRRWQDKQNHLLGKALLAFALKKNGHEILLVEQLSYTQFNRPYIPAIIFDFNISHAGNVVLCACSSDQMVGVDIEKIQDVELHDFKNILNTKDEEVIANSSDAMLAFFKIWSAKEAVLKADGRGLVDDIYKLELNESSALLDNKLFSIAELKIHSTYTSFVASTTGIDQLILKEVTVADCLQLLQ